MSLRRRLAELACLSKNWDCDGGDPPTKAALETVRSYFEGAQIVPCGDGGLQIEWHRHGLDIEVRVDRDGRFMGFAVDRAGVSHFTFSNPS